MGHPTWTSIGIRNTSYERPLTTLAGSEQWPGSGILKRVSAKRSARSVRGVLRPVPEVRTVDAVIPVLRQVDADLDHVDNVHEDRLICLHAAAVKRVRQCRRAADRIEGERPIFLASALVLLVRAPGRGE